MSEDNAKEFDFTPNHQAMLDVLTPYLTNGIAVEFERMFDIGLLATMPLGKHDPKRVVVIREDQRKFTKAQEVWLSAFQDGWRACVAAIWTTTRLEIASE